MLPVLPSHLPYVEGLVHSTSTVQEIPAFHLGLTPLQTFCQVPVLKNLDGHLPADADPADARPGLCTHCLDALEEYRRLTSTTKRAVLTWNEALNPGGRRTAELVRAALNAREHLFLINHRLHTAPEDQRADTLLALLGHVSDAQKEFDALADELVLALRDVCTPAPSWARMGQRLGVTDSAVRNRYARGSFAHPERLQLCTIGGTGCGELRPATRPGGVDPWKHHDLDHEGNPELPQGDDDNDNPRTHSVDSVRILGEGVDIGAVDAPPFTSPRNTPGDENNG
ncbi:hypothetical protein [Kitasatospora sp. NPDC002965]|uniref:hypothetical protein n=1 Tax=Kitasatospora sp. NPDC002965 TaxID=3154775 RepID=UPI0033B0D0BA